MQILVSIDTVKASPQIGEILPLCDFFRLTCPVLSCTVLSCPYLFCFSILRPGRTARPIFTLYGSNDVFLHKEVPFGVDLGAGAEAAKAEPKNIQAKASRISVESKLQLSERAEAMSKHY